MVAKKQNLKIIPLGGLEEIGKNITVFEYGNDIVVLDCGMAFPDEEMPGVDIVIPDFAYLEKNQDRIRAVVLTHGHEDHIGALPYFLSKINVPVYGTRLTIGLVLNKLKEHGLDKTVKLHSVLPGNILKFGEFRVEFIRSNHSIPDAAAIAFHTPVGVILHTGDFKIDSTPIEGKMIDLKRIGELGRKGVLALMSDSTNAERSGYTMSESTVGAAFDEIFRNNIKNRIIVATFASNIHRMQQIVNSAAQYGRKIALSGRSIVNVVTVAVELGHMKLPKGMLIDIDEITNYPPHKLVIITTGSQGEAMSALARMAYSEHRKVTLGPKDTVIISANPIPGNEKAVSKVINELYKLGTNVIYEALADIHVSGHACTEELKIIMNLANPKFFIPVHGEYRHLYHHSAIAQKMGIPEKNIIKLQIGSVLELNAEKFKLNGTVPSGRVFVDGLGVGDVGNIVLRDRKLLAEDGLIVVVVTLDSHTRCIISGPDVVSRGFVYMRESEDLMENIKECARKSIEKSTDRRSCDWNTMKAKIKSDLSDYLYYKTKRKPMILPVIMEV
ncbi:MAG: ribonuclease J [Clostridia bacterium]|nr:ribonuclease J [Clostridia bacterium]